MEKNISPSEVVGKSWEYLKTQIWVLIGLLIGFMIVVGILNIIGSFSGSITVSIFTGLIIFVIQIIFYLGYYKNIFQTIEGEEPQFSAYGEQFPKVLSAILAAIIVGVIVTIGLAFLILPGIYLAIRLMFTIHAIVYNNMGAFDAIRHSWKITKGNELQLFVMGIVAILIIMAGVILLGVGVLVAMPLVYVMSGYLYLKLNTSATEMITE